MPIYEYGCAKCKHTEEIFFNKPIADVVDPITCPECGSEEYARLISKSTFDVPGGSMYEGKRNWKKNLNTYQQADVLMNENVNPY